MKPLAIIGQNFKDIESEIEHSGLDAYPEPEGDSIESLSTLTSKDGTWDALVNSDGIIQTVFLNFDNGYTEFLGFTRETTRKQVIECFGIPEKYEDKSSVPILGDKGAWERYRFATYSVHLEHEVDDERLKMVTIMINEVVP